MKKAKIIVTVFLIISILVVAGYYLYDMRQREANEDFYRDVIMTLNDSYEGYRLMEYLKEKEISEFEFCYEFKEGVSNAKDRMERWESDKNTLRRKVARGMLKGIDDLIIAAEECINVVSEPGEEHTALYKIKLREGRKTLFVETILISVPESPIGNLRLSKSQKKDLRDTIELFFKKEFAEYKIKKRTIKALLEEGIPTEIIAVFGIYIYLSE